MNIKTTIDSRCTVSTVAITGGFETMTFVDGDEVACKRTKSSRSARMAHRRAVSDVKVGGSELADYWSQSVSASVLASYEHARIVTI